MYSKNLSDDINSIILKFVGLKPKQKPYMNELKYNIKKYNFRNAENETFDNYMFNVLHCCACHCLLKGRMLEIKNELCEDCDC